MNRLGVLVILLLVIICVLVIFLVDRQLLSSLLTPTIASMGIIFAGLQWWTNEKKRQNELFDRRYQFYVRLKGVYLSQHNSENQPLDVEDWIPYAEEAGFLFGDDIQKHIMHFVEKKLSGCPNFPEEWFIKPFRKYLNLK